MTGIAFHKYEGLGNDFILVERGAGAVTELTADWVRSICDRHRGVGADGVLELYVEESPPRMRVINADGSVPEMCGNGIRCAALHLAVEHHRPADLVIETDAGPHRCLVSEGAVMVEMRPPSFDPAEAGLTSAAPWIDHPIDVAGRRLHVTVVSMGNPHAVVFDDIGLDRTAVGSAFQTNDAFRQGINVGFAAIRSARQIDLHVLERGAGWTMACGTGACAAAAAAVATGRAPRHEPIEVRLPGGSLTLVIGEEHTPAQMTGPARCVFFGQTAD